MVEFHKFKDKLQYLSLTCSLSINILLVSLAIFKSHKKMGSYKYLIMYFGTFSSILSILESIVHPLFITVGTVFAMATDLSENILESRETAEFLICCTCGCFGSIISLIAIHFIFRFFAIQRNGNLKYFKAKYAFIWFLIPIVYGATWGSIVYLFLEPTDRNSKTLGDYLFSNYNITMDQIVYSGSDYFLDDAKQIINFQIIPAMIILALIINTSLGVVIYFGVKICFRIKNLEKEGVSQHTRKLQKQLFVALVLQAGIPLIILYVPVSIFLFSSLFNVKNENIGQMNTVLYAIYPAIDPLPTIFIVDCYRNALFDFLRKSWTFVRTLFAKFILKFRNHTIPQQNP